MAALVGYVLSLMTSSRPRILNSRKNKYDLPLPKECHTTLSSEKIAGRPVFVIGDVHGCYDELCRLLQLAASHRSNPFVVFVGDMINKGPHNIEVLRLLQQMVINGQAVAVRGNHEETILRELWALHDTKNSNYTLPERYQWLRSLSNEDFHFLQELPYTVSIPSLQTLVMHAGMVPGLPLEQQNLENLTHMRNIITEDFFDGRGFVGSSKVENGEAWAVLWPGPDHVYFGHDAKRGLQLHPFATGLDTGCLYGKCLTGVFVGGCRPEFVSVPAQKAYVQT